MSEATRQLFTSEGFFIGLAIGLAVPLLAAIWPRRNSGPLVGALVAAALLAAIDIVKFVPDRVTLGIVVLAGAGLISDRMRPLSVAGLIVGAWLVAFDDGSTSGQVVGAGVIIGGAPLVASFDRRYGSSGLSLPLLAITALGIVVTLPTTEFVIAAAGVLLTAAVAGRLLGLGGVGPTGAYTAVGILVWLAITGGTPRPGAVIGGVAALGLLVAEPALRRPSEQSLVDQLLSSGQAGWFAVLLGHGALVLFVARVAGLQQGMRTAALIAAPALVLVGMVAGRGTATRRIARTPD